MFTVKGKKTIDIYNYLECEYLPSLGKKLKNSVRGNKKILQAGVAKMYEICREYNTWKNQLANS